MGFFVEGKVVDRIELLRWKSWPWRLDIWPFAILYVVWVVTILPSIDFVDAAIALGAFVILHILTWLFTYWSVDFRCFIQANKVNDIHEANICKVIPKKFVGSKEIAPIFCRKVLAGSSPSLTTEVEEFSFDFRKQRFIFSEEKRKFCKLPYPSKETAGFYIKNTGYGSDAKANAAMEKWGRNVLLFRS